MEWQFPWPYRNNNPIAQMLQMVHYILTFIITMKHVIYGAILSAARGPGGVLQAPPAGSGAEPSGNQFWCILAWESDIWRHQFFIFPDFSKKYFPLTFPWPLKFPDFFQFSLTSRNPECTREQLRPVQQITSKIWSTPSWYTRNPSKKSSKF